MILQNHEILRINNEMYNPKPGSRFLSDFVVVTVTVELMVDWRGRGRYDCCDKSHLQPSFKFFNYLTFLSTLKNIFKISY